MKMNKRCLTFWGVFLLGGTAGINSVTAQISTVTTMTMPSTGEERYSATDILQPHITTGRFGPQAIGGYFAPSPGSGGRLADDGAIYSPSGAFIGMTDSTPNSRFGHYWELSGQSGMPADNSALMYERMKRNQQQEQEIYPQQVSAVRQPALPERTEAGIAEAFPEQSAVQAQGMPTEQPFRNPEQVWMRNPANRRAVPQTAPNDNAPTAADAAGALTAQELLELQNRQNNGSEADLGSRFIGGLVSVQNQNTSAMTAPVSFTPNRIDPSQAIQSRLELAVLQSPQVNPLSPIQVLYNNGQATVRGIVPSEFNRLEAGRILLSDPNVTSVDNRLTVLPSDVNTPRPQSFDPNLPQTAVPSENNAVQNSAIVEMPNTVSEPNPLDSNPQQ